jgi:hypothetical protein
MNDYMLYQAHNSALTMVFAALAIFFANITLLLCSISRRRLEQEQKQDVEQEQEQEQDTDQDLDLDKAPVIDKVNAKASLGKVIGIIVVALLIVIPAGIYTVQHFTPHHTAVADDYMTVPEGGMGVGVLPETYFTNDMSSGKSSGELDITNPKGTQYLEQVELTDAKGKVLYTSPMLRPGQSIKTVTLNTTLAQGYHDYTANFVLYDMTSLRKVAKIGAGTCLIAKWK